MSNADVKANRPLSPHLWIYRWRMTMIMSIVHRITGAGLYLGTALLAWWLMAAATSEHAFSIANGFLGSWFGILILIGFTWALVHHLLGGLRHFVWDTGRGMGKPARDNLAIGNLVASVILTIIVVVIGFMVA
jgi:succinate dehydrogenase / fumarate reductase cytochrome b subunit